MASRRGPPLVDPVAFDTHTHVWSADTAAFPFGPYDDVPVPRSPYPVEHLVRDLGTAGVAAAAVIQPRVYGPDHGYLDEVLRRFPDRLVGVCLADPLRPPSVEELRTRFTPRAGYRGIRMVGLGRDRSWPLAGADVWRAAEGVDAVLSLLVEPHQLRAVLTMARRHPTVTVVIDHLGYCRPGTPRRFVDDMLALADVPEVYLKLSAFGALSGHTAPFQDLTGLVSELLRVFGADRLLWGSDLPHALSYGEYSSSLEAARHHLSGIPTSDRNKVLLANAARIYRR
ncbi:amidohydrolase family protein [Georgenia alba]|uniref:Amidohydrolase family protein n=1 Tax=Georgenia alba TaxID=2233858 RepID=A0ABW2Q9X2_9MICO